MNNNATTILLNDLAFPEGPAFAPNGDLWFVEQQRNCLSRYRNGILHRHQVGGRPNGIAIDNSGLIWFCDSERNQIRTFNSLTENQEVIVSEVEGNPLNLPNDLAFDKDGNLLFTCSGDSLTKGDGYICALSPGKQLKVFRTVSFYPNGLAFNADHSKLFIAETGTHDIWKGKWDSQNMEWTHPVRFTNTGGPVGPDGMAFDEEGNLYIAVYGSGTIHQYNPQGQLSAKIPVAGNNPTNCAFDPSGTLGLVITEAEKGLLISYQTAYRGIL
ncbi:SMP-30/gluconolactonase/LRE family protein [Sphingobacterium spiritivorum]|uniref:SMP-30/gluconolactonase/LRE family protein n=1 Tax=Sphingobacterium spiritivorum TaxID=258 RepID=UPI00191B44DB|nr:SMP-30/gluconolactonase/LRE family protein [Sphingobacterium spiritivorum]QQT26178.1 SMP-30/gluconolactonase/LRE family protein [Sphingobacterium spiritivorum]